MLTHLYIKNYALIEELDIDLHQGFSVITGETGAGKSILLGAVHLLLGQRTDSRSILMGATRCTIEATFSLEGFGLESFFEENDFDFENSQCIIRREFSTNGKSRAFINDTPATVNQLKELGKGIIDIHSQHQNLLLSNESFQFEILDLLGNNQANLSSYHTLYNIYRGVKKEIETLKNRIEQNKQNEDYLRFQISQLSEFNPQPQEDEALKAEVDELSHTEEIKSALYQANKLLVQEPYGIVLALRQVRQQMQSVCEYYTQAESWRQRVDEAYIELKDLAEEVESQTDRLTYDPQHLENLANRLNELYALEKKHHVNSSDELIQILQQYQKQVDEIDHSDEELEALEQKLSHTFAQLAEQAHRITKERKKAAKKLQEQMQHMLLPLGMPHARIEVNFVALDAPSPQGMDEIQFLFAANKNQALRPIEEVASGGEIARVMLSLKCIICQVKQLPTLIFDEIDTGVSGNIADCMATMMRDMATQHGMQVISITHLPQIAALGAHHYRVFKEDTQEQTLSHIQLLLPEERVTEIAHMLSGSQITQAAIENAKQLLQS